MAFSRFKRIINFRGRLGLPSPFLLIIVMILDRNYGCWFLRGLFDGREKFLCCGVVSQSQPAYTSFMLSSLLVVDLYAQKFDELRETLGVFRCGLFLSLEGLHSAEKFAHNIYELALFAFFLNKN